jgi:hypothetical protein
MAELSIGQVAERLGRARNHVRWLIKHRGLPARVSGPPAYPVYVIDSDALDEWCRTMYDPYIRGRPGRKNIPPGLVVISNNQLLQRG